MPSAEAAERRGDRLDLAMIIGLGDQHAGDQRAEDRRQADGGGREAGEDDDQQADREEQLGALGPRRLGEQRRQQQAAEHQHRRPTTSTPSSERPERARQLAACARRSAPSRKSDRHQRQILEQQHGEGGPADRARACRPAAAPARSRTGPAPGRARPRCRRRADRCEQPAADQHAPQPSSSAAPTPNTSRAHAPSRRKLIARSPIEKSSRMMPSSAKGSIACGSVIVTGGARDAPARARRARTARPACRPG